MKAICTTDNFSPVDFPYTTATALRLFRKNEEADINPEAPWAAHFNFPDAPKAVVEKLEAKRLSLREEIAKAKAENDRLKAEKQGK